MKKNILIIKRKKNDVFFDKFNNIESYYCVPSNNILLKIIRKFISPFESFFYSKWKYKINNYDIIILFDNGYSDKIPKYIKNKNKNIKIIFWYWNSLVEYRNTIIENKYIDEIWTYNRFDAEKFNLKLNSQFYYKKIEFNNISANIDVLFLGRDKGRTDSLKQLEIDLKKLDISTYFKIIKKQSEIVKYDDYLKLLEHSKCVLDYSFTLPSGLSLRPLEALFYQKKLITNNIDIMKYDFYNSNNIFVLGVDDMNKINDFLNKPYQKIEKKIVDYYNYYSWIDRFGGK